MTSFKNYPVATRLLVLLLALLAWINPRLPRVGAPAGDVIVVLDDSQSVDRAFGRAVWKGLADQIRQLPAASRIALVRFGAQPALELPLASISSPAVSRALDRDEVPRRLAVDATSTNVEAALLAALRLTVPSRAASVVLLTDAQQTRGDAATALAALADAEVPVLLLRPAAVSTRDTWIEQLHLPAHARQGDAVPVTVTLNGRRDVRGELRVLVDENSATSRTVSLAGATPTTLRTTLPVLKSGPRRITVIFTVPDDPFVDNNRASRIVNVEGPGRILYVHDNDAPTPAAQSLRAGGWTVEETDTAHFARSVAHSDAPSLFVLDDVAADGITDSAWAELETAVRVHGAGLLVLGGPHSFSAGAYRHSRLEGMLPVLSEANRPIPRAAVLFVVDKSGSMDREDKGISRLSMARLGVTASASALLEGDLVGLLAFDAESRELLPLGHYATPALSLDRAWRLNAQGGTRLTPALRAGIARFRALDAERRMMVLVTDGFTEGEDLGSLAEQLRELEVEVIALVIGGNREIPLLERLVRASDGTLLRVHRLANLPRFMRRELERQRKPAELGRQVLIQSNPLPFLGDVAAWPALTGYMVARPRPEATVFLQSRQGDPLLAAHELGTGRAAVLTGGLGAWAQSWWSWSEWGRFLGGMSAWLSAGSGNPLLYVRIQQRGDTHELVVDALSAQSEWSREDRSTLRLLGPGDDTRRVPMTRSAPGRYTSELSLPKAGRYRALIQVGGESRRFEFEHAPPEERIPASETERTYSSWMAAGWIRPWQPGEALLQTRHATAEAPHLRTVLLLLCIVLYVGVLIFERVPLVSPLSRPRLKRWLARPIARRAGALPRTSGDAR